MKKVRLGGTKFKNLLIAFLISRQLKEMSSQNQPFSAFNTKNRPFCAFSHEKTYTVLCHTYFNFFWNIFQSVSKIIVPGIPTIFHTHAQPHIHLKKNFR